MALDRVRSIESLLGVKGGSERVEKKCLNDRQPAKVLNGLNDRQSTRFYSLG